MRLALGMSLPSSNKGGLTPVQKQVSDFKARVIADGGVFEAKACLEAQLTSIVVTPNGYKAGTLYGVLPTYAEGIDLVTNGDFATDLSGWNITGNDATHTVTWTASGARFQSDTTSPVMEFKQLNLLTSGKQYVLTCNIAYTGVGQLRVNVGTNLTPFTEGANTKYFTATSSTMSFLRENANVDAIIDNVIVKEVTSADMDVTRATAATRVDEDGLVNYAEIIGDSILTGNNSNFDTGIGSWVTYNGGTLSHSTNKLEVTLTSGESGARIDTNSLISGGQSGKTFKVRARIWQGTTTATALKIYIGANQENITISSTPTYFEVELTPTSTGMLTIYRAGGLGGVGTYFIDDVTVKEVTRDNVPRIDYTGGGCPHILSEPQRKNEVTYSEDFSNAYFQKIRSTISTDQIVSPDGTQNADKFIEDSALGTKLLWTQDEVISIGDKITWSVFAKKGEREWIMLRDTQAGSFTVFFDLENGVIGTSSGVDSSKIEDYGSGWYRCSITYTSTTTTARGRLYLADADSGESYQGNGTSGLYIWGAQLEEGSYATSYIPTSGSTVTRNQDIFTRDGIGSLINSTEGCVFGEGNFAESDCITFRWNTK